MLPIHLFAMSYGNHINSPEAVRNQVQNTIAADPNPITLLGPSALSRLAVWADLLKGATSKQLDRVLTGANYPIPSPPIF